MRALLLVLIMGCGYGDDFSHLGDLLAHDALDVQITCQYDDSIQVVLANRFYSDGHCLGLSENLTATLNGRAGTVLPGSANDSEAFSTGPESCPEVWFQQTSELGPTFTLELTDEARPLTDPSASIL